MPQTSYTNAATARREGQVLDTSTAEISAFRVESGTAKVGLLLAQGTEDNECTAMPALVAADVDAIATAAPSSLAGSVLSGASLDGAVGDDQMSPAKCVTFIAAASADWGLAAVGGTEIRVVGFDANGAPQSETMWLPSGGAVTLTTMHAYSRVLSVTIGENDGATGTATIGVSNDVVEVGKYTHPGVAVYDPMVEYVAATYEYEAEEALNLMRRGRVAAIPEDAVVAGEEVYVRVVAAGADVRGQFTGDAGALSANFAKVHGARWLESTAADAVGALEINF